MAENLSPLRMRILDLPVHLPDVPEDKGERALYLQGRNDTLAALADLLAPVHGQPGAEAEPVMGDPDFLASEAKAAASALRAAGGSVEVASLLERMSSTMIAMQDDRRRPKSVLELIPEPANGYRTEFDAPLKRLLRPVAETIAMLDGNAFFGVAAEDGVEWYEQYLPEAHVIYEANGGATGWASGARLGGDGDFEAIGAICAHLARDGWQPCNPRLRDREGFDLSPFEQVPSEVDGLDLEYRRRIESIGGGSVRIVRAWPIGEKVFTVDC